MPLRPRNRLRDEIVQELAGLIASGELREVERLKELELAARLGVSRTPLREALLVLESEGLVVSEVNKGFRVAALSEARVRELYPILGSLEALAVRGGGGPLLARAGELCAVNERLRVARGNVRRHALDRQFHELLWSGSENATLVDLLRRLWRQAQQFDGAAERGMADLDGSTSDHAAIADAIGRGELDGAACRLEAHWRKGVDVVIGWLRRRGAPALLPLLVLAFWPACAPPAATPPQPARPALTGAALTNATPRGTALTTAAPRATALVNAPTTAAPTGAATAPAFAAGVSLTPSPCPVPAAPGEGFECFTFVVPENRARPDGKTIALPIVRVRSRAATPGEPLIFLTGGPGNNAFPKRLVREPLEHMLADRDYIVLPQRGTRHTVPELTCPEWDTAGREAWAKNLTFAETVARRRAAAATCGKRLRAAGIDLEGYDTAAVVADLFDLGRALGLSGYHLYGLSYGTLVALEALRSAPSPSPIRSVVLDSTLPPDVRYDEFATDNVLRSLDRLLDQCAVDPACGKAYPRLRARWGEALARAQRSPATISITPPNGAPFTMKLSARNLIDAVASTLESPSKLATLPRFVDDIARGRFEGVASIVAEGAEPSSTAYGQRLSIWCRDEANAIDWRAVEDQIADHPELGGYFTAAFARDVCAAWPASPSKAPHSPVISTTPTLILAGEYDPVTPPEWGRRAARTLSQSYFVEIPGMSHGASFRSCGNGIVLAFLRDPTRLPDVTCVARTPALTFELR